MLKKENRLKNKYILKALFFKGRTFKSPFFLCKFFPKNLTSPCFSFLVTKKVNKSAVVRNKITRRVKAALIPKINYFPDINALFIISLKAKDAPFTLLEKEIDQLLKFILKYLPK